MTIIYREVAIESAEQAEALPLGTVATHTDDQGQIDQTALRIRGGWEFSGVERSPGYFPADEGIGLVALVPTEVSIQGHRIHEGAKVIEATYYIHEERRR